MFVEKTRLKSEGSAEPLCLDQPAREREKMDLALLFEAGSNAGPVRFRTTGTGR